MIQIQAHFLSFPSQYQKVSGDLFDDHPPYFITLLAETADFFVFPFTPFPDDGPFSLGRYDHAGKQELFFQFQCHGGFVGALSIRLRRENMPFNHRGRGT